MSIASFVMVLGFAILANLHGLPINDVTSSNPKFEQSKEKFEGDMLFPTINGRGVAIRGTAARWPSGIVPYEISPVYADAQRTTIINAMRTLESATAINSARCVQFRARVSSDEYYITIVNGTGCSSYVGRNTGVTMNRTVTLQHPGCIYIGTIMHELLHALGFYHEQSRPDRDSYIQVNYTNIDPNMRYNFDKYTTTSVDTQNTPYDYASIMHYPRDAFSANGYPTIIPLQANAQIGQRYNLSTIDIQEVRLYYNCTANGVTLPPTTTTTTAPVFKSTYSGVWSSNSPLYARPPATTSNYYFDAILVTVYTTGTYIITSNSTIDTYGYFYNNTFTSTNPSINLIAQDDDSNGNVQFKMVVSLQAGRIYTIVSTTYGSLMSGTFSVFVVGPAVVGLSRINIVTTTTTTTQPTTTSTTPAIKSTYSGVWSSSSPLYARPPATTSNYYFDAILVTVYTTGTYIITSNSTIDTYGYFYNNTFTSTNPSINLIAQDDDSGGNVQFKMVVSLQAGRTYTIVSTTYGSLMSGTFSVFVVGPAVVGLSRINIMTTTSTTTATIAATTPSAIVYSQSFSTGISASSQCTAWNTFRTQLIVRNYSSLKINGTNNPTGITLTNSAYATSIAQALRTNTTYGPVSSDGYSWMVGSCNACGNGVELTATGNICQCGSGYTVRPCIGTSNWGGINGATCNGVSQAITVTFQ